MTVYKNGFKNGLKPRVIKISMLWIAQRFFICVIVALKLICPLYFMPNNRIYRNRRYFLMRGFFIISLLNKKKSGLMLAVLRLRSIESLFLFLFLQFCTFFFAYSTLLNYTSELIHFVEHRNRTENKIIIVFKI